MLIQALASALGVYRLYADQHPSCLAVLERTVRALAPLFRDEGKVSLEVKEEGLLINGTPVTQPPELVRWFVTRLRRCLIKGVVIAPEVERERLSALFRLLAKRIEKSNVAQLRGQLDEIRSEHLSIFELDYSPQSAEEPDAATARQRDWFMAMNRAAPSVMTLVETNALASRLERLSLLHCPDASPEEADIVDVFARWIANTLDGEPLADDYQMELLLTHMLTALDGELERIFQEPATFRRRQVLGNVAGHLFKRTPDLIPHIAESAGVALVDREEGPKGINPAEVLKDLFVRTSVNAETGEKPALSGKALPAQRPSLRAADSAAMLERFSELCKSVLSLPGMIEKNEIMRHFVDFLAKWLTLGDAPSQSQDAVKRLQQIIADEVSLSRSGLASSVSTILGGHGVNGLSLDMRRSLFAELDCRELLRYLSKQLPTRLARARSLRAAWEVIGDSVLEEIIRLNSDGADARDVDDSDKLAAEALASELVPVIRRSAKPAGKRICGIAMAVADHLTTIDQSRLLSDVLGQLGANAPLDLALRVAGIPTALAQRGIRGWLEGVSHENRRSFAGRFLLLPDAGDLGITSEIASGLGVWRKMYPQRQAALDLLARSAGDKAQQLLEKVARAGRWSLSAKTRSLAKFARRALVDISHAAEDRSIGENNA